MKYRKSHVTNSSSSSFIGVFAKIKDEKKALASLGDNKYDDGFYCNDNITITSGKNILERMANCYWGNPFDADWAGVYITPDVKCVEEDSKYLVFTAYGGAGNDDSDFQYGDDYELNYDVCLSDFRENEQEIYKAVTEENGFTKISKSYGAGRNG